MSKNEHRSSKAGFLIFFLFCVPTFVEAVYLSEIAWMGSLESANHEWIELHNDGSARSVDGWTLSDGANLSIELSGTIPANRHVVLERTSDESAPGGAFLVYTGALVNGGATLRLLDENGAVVDQVAGGTDWSNVGGDNITKETAQYTARGWVTAPATPGSAAPEEVSTEAETESDPSEPETAEDSDQVANDQTEAKKSSGGSSGEPIQLAVPDVTLELEIAAPTIGYVNQPIRFAVEPSGIGKHLLGSLRYEWNFGDTGTARSEEPTHVYQFPGTYLVTVFGGYKRQHQVAQHEITILPVAISLTQNGTGDVQINNDARYDVDVSGYRLVGHDEVEFPPRSVLLAGQTVTVPGFKVKDREPAMLALYDRAGVMAASRFTDESRFRVSGTVARRESVSAQTTSAPTPRISALATSRTESVAAGEGPAESSQELFQAEGRSVEQLASVSSAGLPRTERLTYVFLVVTMLLAVLGVYLMPKRNDS